MLLFSVCTNNIVLIDMSLINICFLQIGVLGQWIGQLCLESMQKLKKETNKNLMPIWICDIPDLLRYLQNIQFNTIDKILTLKTQVKIHTVLQYFFLILNIGIAFLAFLEAFILALIGVSCMFYLITKLGTSTCWEWLCLSLFTNF